MADQPLKAASIEPVVSPDEIQAIAEAGCEALTAVEADTETTCIDEREREGLLSGENTVEARQSVPGASNIYALYISEMTGMFAGEKADSVSRLTSVTKVINSRGIHSGGHEKCAANELMNDVFGLIGGADVEAGKDYAKE